MNERLQEDRCPDGVELGGLTHLQKHPTYRQKQQKVQVEKLVSLQSFLPDTHGRSHTFAEPASVPSFSPSTLTGLGRLSLGVRGCPAHKETLGDGISRLTADSHMSSSSNWYSKLYTFKCHQERAKPTRAFLCSGSTFMGGGSFAGTTMRP